MGFASRLFLQKNLVRFFLYSLLSLPILFFCLDMLKTGNLLPSGDADYLMQTVLASRISILDFHQFPWWNPWVSGGVPLFANPQFGLISLPTLLALPFGAVLGYKLAIFFYFLLGFYGLIILFKKGFKTPTLTAILLGYVWTFGTFLTYRSLGHYTFLTIQFLPLMFYFYIARDRIKLSWLWLGLIAGLAALAAAHNMTILSYIVLAMLIIIDLVFLKFNNLQKILKLEINVNKKTLVFLAKFSAVFIVITFYRLFYTLSYLNDYPRSQLTNPEPSIGILKGIFAIAGPFRQFNNPPHHPQWSWLEASAYIGICTCIAAVIIIYTIWKRRKTNWRSSFSYSPIKIIAIGSICFIIAMGNFIGELSPYSLIRHLPALSSMRVASRWLVFCSLMILFFIATYRGKTHRIKINILLIVSVVELFFISRPFLAQPYIFQEYDEPGVNSFQQKKNYKTMRGGISYDENFTDATINNYGQIIAGDSLIDTRPGTENQTITRRCPVDLGCNLVLSNNADVKYWSPNKIVLERTSVGDILLNTNPGNGWLVNNLYIFGKMKVVDPSAEFRITDTSKTIEVKMVPRFSIQWIMWKM